MHEQPTISDLRDEVRGLADGLILLNATVGALTEMVGTLVGLATTDGEGEGENPLVGALSGLTAAVNRTGMQVAQMREAMTGATLRGAGRDA